MIIAVIMILIMILVVMVIGDWSTGCVAGVMLYFVVILVMTINGPTC